MDERRDERTFWDDLRDYGRAFAIQGRRIDPADVVMREDGSLSVALPDPQPDGQEG